MKLHLGVALASYRRMLRNFKAYQLAKEHYWHCKELKLPSFLKDQRLRASSSVALTLAEGSGKRTPADQRRFYAMAYGSFRECQAIIELEKLNDTTLDRVQDQLGAILFTLSRKNCQQD
jgi:four helix bundle protein